MGWKLCSTDICKASDGGEKLQTRTLLSGQSEKANLLSGFLVDMLYLFSLPVANSLPTAMENFQLRSNSPRHDLEPGYAMVVLGCKEMVQRTCKKCTSAQWRLQLIHFFLEECKSQHVSMI